MLVVRRIHVRYHLRLDPEHRVVAERVHGGHADACPVYRTLGGCVAITTSLTMEHLADSPAGDPWSPQP